MTDPNTLADPTRRRILEHLAQGNAFDLHADAAYHSDVTTQLNPSVIGYRPLGGFTTVNAALGYTVGKA